MSFRPKSQPARDIYDVWAEISNNREGNDWVKREKEIVLQAAISGAEKYNLKKPTMEDVEKAEKQGLGHVDYGAKWVYSLINIMRKVQEK